MDFIKWLVEEKYSNIFTLTTVILSALISLVISHLYYHIGNRNNLKIIVICPLLDLLKLECCYDNYKIFSEIYKDYSIRYMNKKETEKFKKLFVAYKQIYSYDKVDVYSEILQNYFEYKLKLNNINVNIYSYQNGDGDIVYSTPPEMRYMKKNLQEIIKGYVPEFTSDICTKEIKDVYKFYCEEFYTSEEIIFFDDFNIDEVLLRSKINKKWKNKFDNFEIAKNEFLNLKIIKKLNKDI